MKSRNRLSPFRHTSTGLVLSLFFYPHISARAQTPPLLYTTLDNAASVSSPASGTGTGSSVQTTPANDFVTGKAGNGVRIDASGEYVRFAQTDGSVQNVELDQGTVDLWYQPSYAHTDGLRHSIVGIGTWGSGGIFLEKNNASNNNNLTVYTFDSSGNFKPTNVPPSSYSWQAGDWVHLRLTWDTT
jgi:parallel beta-helix repeat protein